MEGLADASRGTLRFGITQLGIDVGVGSVLPVLHRQNPNLILHIEVGYWQLLLQKLRNEEIEFFIGYPGSTFGNPDFITTPLTTLDSSIFCRPEHPLAQEARPELHQVADYPWAVFPLLDDFRPMLRKFLGIPKEVALPVALTCNSQTLLREAILSSDMLLLTWQSWLVDDLDRGSVIDLGKKLRPALPRTMTKAKCAVVQMAHKTLSPGAQRLLSLLAPVAARLQKDPGRT